MIKTLKLVGIFTLVLAAGAGIGWFVASTQMKPPTSNSPKSVAPLQPSAQSSSPIAEATPPASMKESSTPVLHTLTLGDIQLTLPDTWMVTEHSTTHALIQTETSPYRVELVLDKKAMSSEDIALYKDPSAGAGFRYTTIPDGEVFVLGCGGPVSCNGVILGSIGYNLSWTVQSTQPIPDNLDGIWQPDSKVTGDDIEGVMKTIRLVK